MGKYIDIKKLTLGELAGVVNSYPWFGAARKELCERMGAMGGDALGMEQYAEAAMYIGSRKRLSDIMRASCEAGWTDADIERLLKSYIAESGAADDVPVASAGEKRREYAGVGDYFSREDYEKVRKADDNSFSKFASNTRQGRTYKEEAEGVDSDFFTETLAGIYMEQGYPEQAKLIYSKLILAYPEKNAYFAALIEKIDELNTKN